MNIIQKFAVIDNTNHLVRCFDSYQLADNFRSMNGRLDWLIVSYYPSNNKSTIKQVAAVHFCECILNIHFEGDINNKQECSHFLSENLEQAKQMYTELKCEYEADRGY